MFVWNRNTRVFKTRIIIIIIILPYGWVLCYPSVSVDRKSYGRKKNIVYDDNIMFLTTILLLLLLFFFSLVRRSPNIKDLKRRQPRVPRNFVAAVIIIFTRRVAVTVLKTHYVIIYDIISYDDIISSA